MLLDIQSYTALPAVVKNDPAPEAIFSEAENPWLRYLPVGRPLYPDALVFSCPVAFCEMWEEDRAD